MSRAYKPLKRWEIVRDVLSFIFGWALIFQQALLVPPGDVNEAFLVLAFNLIVGPGALQAYAARGSRPGTGEQSSPPVPSPSQRQRSSSRYDTEVRKDDKSKR